MKLKKEDKDQIVEKIQNYFEFELEHELGQFDAGFLLDFLQEELGPYFYNQGLYDAQAVIASKVEEIENGIFEIEKPTGRK